MKITFKDGNKTAGDKLFFIESNGKEAFNHARLMILLNQLAINEYKIYTQNGWDKKGKDFLFPIAILDAIEQGKNGTDFLDDKNENALMRYCNRNYLKFSKFKQSKLGDFGI
jgi:hypothetical protein